MFTPTLRLWDCKVQGYKLITLPTISLYDYGECEVSVVSSVQYSTVYSVQYSQWEQDPTLSVVLGSSGREDRRGVSAVPVNMLHSYNGSLLYNLETWQIHHHQQLAWWPAVTGVWGPPWPAWRTSARSTLLCPPQAPVPGPDIGTAWLHVYNKYIHCKSKSCHHV